MSPTKMTYNELLASPNMETAVNLLSDADLRAVRGWLARGEAVGWVAERVHGVCILEGCRRFEGMKRTTNGHEWARMEEAVMHVKITVDSWHGSEVVE